MINEERRYLDGERRRVDADADVDSDVDDADTDSDNASVNDFDIVEQFKMTLSKYWTILDSRSLKEG